ncbi:MAG: hypothetical protein HY741_23510, partial [Chloroflexi bacterium]|nr:hypothetical protein [Chloroflexota bacterium]
MLGGIGLVALVVLLNGMFQQQAAVTAARRTPTAASFKPTPKATKPAKVDWENATLEQIKFGKTRTILKQNAQIKIWSWLPDNRRLLLELLDPEAKDVESAFRIITLDVKTGEIVEYGRRGDGATAPELIEQTESAVYLYSNWQTGQGPQTRIGGTDGKVQQMTEGYAAYSVHPRTGEIYYRVAGTQPNSLRLLDPSQHELTPRILFPSLSLPPGSPLIDPKGRTMAIVGSPEWGMLNLVTGQFQAFAVAAQVKNGTATGTSSEKWSPNGKQIAFTFTQDPNFDIALVPPLSLFDATTGKVQSAKLPIPGVVEF